MSKLCGFFECWRPRLQSEKRMLAPGDSGKNQMRSAMCKCFVCCETVTPWEHCWAVILASLPSGDGCVVSLAV